ncbi:hypothetical protein FNV43_RR19597 [Rhamnella rubrinervis]|uniref:DUF1985 domain-containing protein n=1 Tax=Rhamnella rubrinervis TaxID=2594499 RepID=A0A8K0DZ26_9ROSA|nr:hypothetical protein FNV43_RR19597 [Rhamnella rubrinervis]
MAEAKPLMYPNALANADNYRVRVTCRSSLITCIKDILEKFLNDPDKPFRFKKRQLKKFENNYFGTLYLRMQEIIMSATIVHNMLVRQADNIREDRSKLEDKDDMVRLALIYFLECGLLGKESQVSIDIHLSMVEDLEYFNEYAWGLESYNATISSKHRVLALYDGGLNESVTYSLSGFPQAFQTIPLMGELYATKVDNSFPRICNWKATNLPVFKSVGKALFDNVKIILHSHQIPPSKKHKRRRKETISTENADFAYYQQQDASNLEGPSFENVGQQTGSSHEVNDDIISAIHSLDIKVDCVANNLNTFRLDSMREFQDFRSESMREIQSIKDSIQEIFIYMKNEYHRPDTYENMPMNEDGEIRDEETNVMQNDSDVQFISPSKVIQREPRIKKRTGKLKSPFVVSIETREILNNILPHPMDFDPKRPFPDDISMKFFNYLTFETDEIIDYSICEVNKEFFWDLVQGEWLNDKHVNVICMYIRKSYGVFACKTGIQL